MSALYFPIDVLSRDLDYRLVLAAHCAHPGREIWIGSYPELHQLAKRSRGGVWVGTARVKGAAASQARVREMREAGIRVVYLTEEGAFYPGEGADWVANWAAKCDPAGVRDETVLAWGSRQAECWRDRCPLARVVVSGHPRFDLTAPPYSALYEEEVAGLRERFGPFILFASRFGWATNPEVAKKWLRSRGHVGATIGTPNGFRFWSGRLAGAAHLVLAAGIAHEAFPEKTIVFRPHPNEPLDFYHVPFAGLDRVRVIREGPVIPWILAADALVHTGCTTAVEAGLAGKPVVSVVANPDDDTETKLPNGVGEMCGRPEDIARAVRAAMEARGTRLPDGLGRVLANADPARTEDSFRIVARVIEGESAAGGHARVGRPAFWRGLQNALLGRTDEGSHGIALGAENFFRRGDLAARACGRAGRVSWHLVNRELGCMRWEA